MASSGNDRLNIHSEPGYDNNVIAQIDQGDIMIIVGDAEVVSGERWWPVLLDDGGEGWVTELWIVPLSSRGSSESSTQQFTLANPQIPPKDVLQQIMFYAAGGGGCDPCVAVDGNWLVLYEFDAKQLVRVLVYQESQNILGADSPAISVGRFVTEWDVTVDSTGQKVLEAGGGDLTSHELVVVDAHSGEVLACTLASDDPIVPRGGWRAGSIVMANPIGLLDIWSGPGYDNSAIAQVHYGDTLTIIGDSKVASGERWWPVRLDDGGEGWVTELWIVPSINSSFSEEEAQQFILTDFQVPPSDVLQQIAFYPGGGGRPCDANCLWYDDNRLVLDRFDANCSVRVIVCKITEFGPNTEDTYGGVCRFITEWDVVVGNSGTLKLEISGGDLMDYEFIVVDAYSGEVLGDTRFFIGSPIVLGGGWGAGSVVMANSGEDCLNIRGGPSYEHKVIAKAHHGDTMTITGSSEVVSRERWWPVRLSDGIEGWVTELWIAPEGK